MVRLGERGVSDVVVIAFMFILLVLSSTLLLGYTPGGLSASAERQSELRTNCLYRTLGKAEVRPGVSGLRAITERLVLEENASIDNGYLRSWTENALEFLSPLDHGAELRVALENWVWEEEYPSGVEEGEDYVSQGAVVITGTGGEVWSADVRVRVFEVLD